MTMNEILDDMENILIDAARLPFTNKRVIEEDDFARLLDSLREAVPQEIIEARQIINERKRILEDAQKEAQNIVNQGKNYVLKLTDENVITQQAQEQASEILASAQSAACSLQNDAVVYADEVFTCLEANIEKALEVIRAGHSGLYQQKK